jgi:hypothetical protein
VIDDDAVVFLELAATGAGLDDLAGGLVAGDDALVALGAFAEMLVIDAANIGAANGGGFDAEEDLAMAGRKDGVLVKLGGAIAGKDGALHEVWDGGHGGKIRNSKSEIRRECKVDGAGEQRCWIGPG